MSELPTKDPERFAKTFQERLKNGDFWAIFMHGCCYHFALTLHELYKHPLEYLPSESSDGKLNGRPAIGHCWALKQEGLGIDVNGVHRVTLLKEIYNPGCLQTVMPIAPETLHASLMARRYPDAVNDEAFKLAHDIITTHERFSSARSVADDIKSIFGQSALT